MRTNSNSARPIIRLHAIFATLVSIVALLIPAVSTAQSYTIEILHSFAGGTDGQKPTAGLIRDASGNLYGVAPGDSTPSNEGIIFKISSTGVETVLYRFTGSPDGQDPAGPLLMDNAGNLFGTTTAGGSSNLGTVFKLSASGRESVLYSFVGGSDGASPVGGYLIMDAAGNLYGTTQEGGGTGCNSSGCGTVFKLSPDGSETVLHSFTDVPDGANPESGLVMDANGNLYGTTFNGGAHNRGTVYKVTPTGAEVVLYSFRGPDGSGPWAKLYRDKAGDLFGTTVLGGKSTACTGCGTIFELFVNGKEVVLHAFTNRTDGYQPYSDLVRDKVGNFYGTATGGGSPQGGGNGTVFKLATNGTFTTLHSFSRSDGANPYDGLVLDSSGNLYGTTLAGGAHKDGVVFELTP